MADQEVKPSFTSSTGFRVIVLVLVLIIGGVGTWLFLTRGQESTDDAQVDAHVIPIAARGIRRHSLPLRSRRFETPMAMASRSHSQMSMMNSPSEWNQSFEKGDRSWTE